MSGVPRSQALIRWASAAAGSSPSWSTPDNCVTLVKSIFITNQDPASHTVLVRIGSADAGTGQTVYQKSLATGEVVWFEHWFVLNPHDFVYVNTDGPNTLVWVSGAVLLGPPPFPPAATILPASEPNR